ncbi:hypothetical protein T4A_8008 [Trichinella pseudospiralis]|uniref:Uncharacterized protein n=1 Tax=Trichinella pseudospiralis TaxID=6337 RepID=A0A0V1DPM3_TRIPS|nr:hypothetical protein T4A_8008 [Trichinella pseudospiralis]
MELYASVEAKNIVQLMYSGLDHTPVLLLDNTMRRSKFLYSCWFAN